jgi:hypothetical protein
MRIALAHGNCCTRRNVQSYIANDDVQRPLQDKEMLIFVLVNVYTHDRIKRSDLDPALLIWGLRKRVDLSTLPDRRVVLRFEFSGVPASRTKFRIMWLILGRSGVDVCMKDPGFAVDLTLRGNIRDYVEVYLGHTKWRDVAGTALQFDGDLRIARAFPVWLRFETVGRSPNLSS